MPDDATPRPLDEAPPRARPARPGPPPMARRAIIIGGLAALLGAFYLILPTGTRLALVRSLFVQRSVVLVLVLFILVALSLLWSAGQRIDAWLFLTLNLHSYHSIGMDRAMRLVTQLGSFPFAAVVIAVLYLTSGRRAAIVMVTGQLTLWIVVEVLKVVTDRGRPFTLLESARVVGWRALGLSFPSGHSAQAFFLATMISHHTQAGLLGVLPIYALAVTVGFTRIYVGAHYPRDVIGGALLGSVWGIISILVDTYLQHLPL